MKKLIIFASMMFSLCSLAQTQIVKETFGGPSAQVYIFDDFSARIDFECATGTVQAGRWPTGQSRIAATGIYTPILIQRAQKATFKANVDVSTGKMVLAVKVGSLRAVNYQLVRGQKSQFKRCR